jgi:hypothetical protein
LKGLLSSFKELSKIKERGEGRGGEGRWKEGEAR